MSEGYKITKFYPKEETYGLISQMRRASVSIIANLAEGCGKKHIRELIKFVSIAIGSSNEIGVYLNLSKDLKYINVPSFKRLISDYNEISKMLYSLRKSLELKKNKN